MSINKFVLNFIYLAIMASCTFESPVYHYTNNCIYLKKSNWFKSVTIINETSDNAFVLTRNKINIGSDTICFPHILDGYSVSKNGFHQEEQFIDYNDNDTITIINMSGDRGSFSNKFKVNNGQLVNINTSNY